jgi:porphobilinogen synthase
MEPKSFENTPLFPMGHPHARPRRLRKTDAIRALVQESRVHRDDLIHPLFVTEASDVSPIPHLPEAFRFPLKSLLGEVESCAGLGLKAFLLAPVVDPDKKNPQGSEAFHDQGLMAQSIAAVKARFPEIVLMADVALDPFTSHGHDGVLNAAGDVANDETVQVLCQQSLTYAASGIDFLCPSDMMDGRVTAIRAALDAHGYQHVGIISHTCKYASNFYGPYRGALQVAERSLNKKTYQMSFTNQRESLREIRLDLAEGADMLMIKPALPYLDIIAQAKVHSDVPIATYHVSGECALLRLGAQAGILNEPLALFEVLVAMKRAGADLIATYYAKWACENAQCDWLG